MTLQACDALPSCSWAGRSRPTFVFDDRSMCTHLRFPFWSILLRWCGPQLGYPTSSAPEERVRSHRDYCTYWVRAFHVIQFPW